MTTWSKAIKLSTWFNTKLTVGLIWGFFWLQFQSQRHLDREKWWWHTPQSWELGIGNHWRLCMRYLSRERGEIVCTFLHSMYHRLSWWELHGLIWQFHMHISTSNIASLALLSAPQAWINWCFIKKDWGNGRYIWCRIKAKCSSGCVCLWKSLVLLYEMLHIICLGHMQETHHENEQKVIRVSKMRNLKVQHKLEKQ